MPRPRMIGLCGKAGAGKSESAKILAARYGFEAIHIGRPLKSMLRALLLEIGYSPELADRYIDGDRKRDLIPELRVTSTEAQQSLGTEWGRGCCYAGLWLDLWLAKGAGRLVINESVRFANEAEAIRLNGGILIEVWRPGLAFTSDHVSETMPFAADYRVINDGDLELLAIRLAGVIERHERLEA